MIHRRCSNHPYDLEALNRTAALIPMDPAWRMPITVSLAAGHHDLMRIRIGIDREIHFELSANEHHQWLRDIAVHCMVCVAELFCYAKHVFPDLSGICDLWKGEAAEGPGLCFTGNTQSHVCIPDFHFLESGGYAEFGKWAEQHWIPWAKREARLFWRGASTGIRELVFARSWRDLPRFALCLRAGQMRNQERFDIGLSSIVQVHDALELQEIKAAGLVKGEVTQAEFMRHRWAIDIDGNSCAWSSLFTKMLMQNTVVKVDSRVGFREWYYDRLIPWKNYVPLSWNMSDLDDTVDWLVNNPREAEDIAERGRRLALDLSVPRVRAEAAEQICRYLTKGPTALPPIADIVTETPPLPRPDLPIALGISPGGHLSAATASSHRSYVRISEDLANPHPFVATVRQAFSTAVTDAAILAGGIAEIPGMTGWRSRNFLYALLTGMDDPRYLEIGLWAGGSFAAAASVGKLRGVGIDDWSWGPGTADICKSNFASFRHKDADIRIIDADYRNVAYEQLGSFNVYFYDGPTDPGDHSDALSRPLPVLDDCFVFIANNWNWRHVRDSARTAISDNDLDVVLAIEIRSTIDDSHPAWSGSASEWHNGFFVSILRKRTTA